jgi:hypothetical protein
MPDRKTIMRWMTWLLVVCYGLAGVLSAVDPDKASAFLLVASVVITAPYFIMQVVMALVSGWVITGLVVLVAILFPPVIAVLAFLGLLALVLRMAVLVRNLPYLLTGALLYACLQLPRTTGLLAILARQQIATRIAAGIAAGALAGGLMIVALRLLELYGGPRPEAAAITLGFISYIGVFLLLLILSLFGHAHHSLDGGGGGDADHDWS